MVVWIMLFLPLLILLIILSDWDSDIALHLLDLLDNFELCSRVKHVSTPSKQKLQMLGHISSSNVDPLNSVVDWESLENWTAMAYSISAIENQSWGFTTSIKTQHCLLLEKDLGSSKLLEENICGFNSVVKWIQRWLSKQDRMFLGLHLQLVKNMAPKGLHIVPILNNSVLNWVSQLQDSFVFILQKGWGKFEILTAASPIKTS